MSNPVDLSTFLTDIAASDAYGTTQPESIVGQTHIDQFTKLANSVKWYNLSAELIEATENTPDILLDSIEGKLYRIPLTEVPIDTAALNFDFANALPGGRALVNLTGTVPNFSQQTYLVPNPIDERWNESGSNHVQFVYLGDGQTHLVLVILLNDASFSDSYSISAATLTLLSTDSNWTEHEYTGTEPTDIKYGQRYDGLINGVFYNAFVGDKSGSPKWYRNQAFIEPGDTDSIDEGTSNLYFTNARVASAPAVIANSNKTGVPATNTPGLLANQSNAGGHDLQYISFLSGGGYLDSQTYSAQIALLENNSNWNAGLYNGATAITNTVFGQRHYNANDQIIYEAIADNTWIRFQLNPSNVGFTSLSADLDTQKNRIGYDDAPSVSSPSTNAISVALNGGVQEIDCDACPGPAITITLTSAKANWTDAVLTRIILKNTDALTVSFANAVTADSLITSLVTGKRYIFDVLQYDTEFYVQSAQSFAYSEPSPSFDLESLLQFALDSRETRRTANSWTIDGSNYVTNAVGEKGNNFVPDILGITALTGEDFIKVVDNSTLFAMPSVSPGTGAFTALMIFKAATFGAKKTFKFGGANWWRLDSTGITPNEGSGAVNQLTFSSGNFNTGELYFIAVVREADGDYKAYRLNSGISSNVDNIETSATQSGYQDDLSSTTNMLFELNTELYYVGLATTELSLADIKSAYTELKTRFPSL